MSELEEWLKFMDEEPVLNDEISEYIEREKIRVRGFLQRRSYCMPALE